MAPNRTFKTATVLVIGALAMTVAACGGGTKAPAAASKDFPSDQFPTSTFGNLSGSVVWYDGSGGATTKARNDTLFKDFTSLTGVTTQPDFTGDTAKFFATMENGGQVPWSLIEFPTRGDFLKAKEAGYLQKLDTSVVPVDKLQNGTHDEYGVDVLRYGITLTYNTKKWPTSGQHPSTLADLLDTSKFPGKRCMYQYPQYGGTLEAALLADGVAKSALYPLDVDRALKKLDTIKKDIVWWSDGDKAIRLLTSGECDLGVAWSGRVFNAVTKDKANLAISWDNSLYTDAVYAVPKGAPNAKAGQALLAMWILDKAGQVKMVSQVPYTTAISDIKPADYPSDLTPWLPSGANAEKAIPEDEVYYSRNISTLTDAFNKWVSKK
jgi:putative spermidine/putrescine transport system substrate-binding protein